MQAIYFISNNWLDLKRYLPQVAIMGKSSTEINGQYVKAVHKKADGTIIDLGYHGYVHLGSPWTAFLLDHTDRTKDAGLHEYWNKTPYRKFVLQVRLLILRRFKHG